MNHSFFRRNPRKLAIITSLPLALTTLTGVMYSFCGECLNYWDMSDILLAIHTGKILKLEAIYPVLNGVGFMGLLISGLVMLRKRKVKQRLNNQPQTPIQ